MQTTQFKNLKINHKLGLIFLIMSLIAALNFSFSIYTNISNKSATLINVADENHALSRRLVLMADRIATEPVEEEFKENVNRINNSLNVLRNGGELTLDSKTTTIPPASEAVKPTLERTEKLWEEYYRQAQLILTQPALIEVTIKGTNYSQSQAKQKKVKRPNPEVISALKFIQANSRTMKNLYDQLVGLYVRQAAEKQNTQEARFLIIGLLLTAACIIAAFYVVKRFISEPIKEISVMAKRLAQGDLNTSLATDRSDEIGKANAELDKMTQHLKEAAQFAQAIGTGTFDAPFEPSGQEDELAIALLKMRDQLQEVQIVEDKRKWTTEGLSRFSELLRIEYQDLNELAAHILSELINYTDSNQGSLFVVNDTDPDDPYLELIGTYAWNKRKYIDKRIEPGDGLAGQVWLEKESIYLEEFPEDYISITSGLGQACPTSLLIVPLKVNEEVFGILEIASFKRYQTHEREFVEKLAENIASEIASEKTNAKTLKYLQESQKQGEELRAQEEELRQNMEELEATQENMRRKEVELGGQLEAINMTNAVIEFTPEGHIIKANDNFLQLMQYTKEEIAGRHHRIFVKESESRSDQYRQFWNDLAGGKSVEGEFERLNKDGASIWIKGVYCPIKATDGKVERIIKLAYDISDLVKVKQEIFGQLEAIDLSVAKIEFNPDGTIINANEHFLALMGYQLDEIKGRHHRIFVDKQEQQSADYQKFWKALRNNENFEGTFKRFTKSGTIVWIKGVYCPVLDKEGRVYKVIKLASDVSNEKQLQQSLAEQMESAREQESQLRDLLEDMQSKQEQLEAEVDSLRQ